jgi:hypothetical protein
MICLLPLFSESNFESGFDSFSLISTTNDCFEQHSLVLCQGIFWKSHHFPVSCWLWSLIIFPIQRSLLSAVFIPHEVFTPQKYVHSSTQGSAEGGYPLCGVRGGYPPDWGLWGQAGPQRGFGGEALEEKIAL